MIFAPQRPGICEKQMPGPFYFHFFQNFSLFFKNPAKISFNPSHFCIIYDILSEEKNKRLR